MIEDGIDWEGGGKHQSNAIPVNRTEKTTEAHMKSSSTFLTPMIPISIHDEELTYHGRPLSVWYEEARYQETVRDATRRLASKRPPHIPAGHAMQCLFVGQSH